MSVERISRAFGITPEQLRRSLPFFAVYLILFTALTITDGVSVSLFASQVGAEQLPLWYACTAVLSMGMIGAYLTQATRVHAAQMFFWICSGISLLLFAAWAGYHLWGGNLPLGLLFITREIALTLVLMHFGTFLQDYFVRAELSRIFPFIYSGGRLGGILGGISLASFSQEFATMELIPIVIGLFLLAWGGIRYIAASTETHEELPTENETPQECDEITAGGFLKQLWSCSLLRWLTATTLLFIACRWFLVYQYTTNFEVQFSDEKALARFLGTYTQIALMVSLILQLFLVNRLVRWLGVSTTNLLYSSFILVGLLGNALTSGLPIAVASRFLETELRFGLRNPVNQMMLNRFSKKLRILVRGWNLGWLIPAGTLVTSGLVAVLLQLGGTMAIATMGLALGLVYLAASFGVGKAYNRYELL